MVQLQVLNSIINKKDSSMLLLNNLTEEFFSDYPNEFGFIKRHLTEYGQIPDLASLLDRFPDFEVIEVTEPTSYLLAELYKDKNTRFLAKTFNQVRKLLGEGKTEVANNLIASSVLPSPKSFLT